MPTIRVIKATSTGLTPVWNNVQSVQIGSPLDNGEGGFGEVFDCIDVNGSATRTPLVIKILKQDAEGNDKRGYATIRKLQERIGAKNQELYRIGRSIAEIPGLYALPQFSFEGVLGNQSVLGYAAHKLDSRLFCSFDDILENRSPEFYRLDLNRKFQLALDMAECFIILREINYIHADINPKNLFVSLKDGHLVLIDYDSGVVVERPQDAPTTWGKPDEWVAPEVAEQQNNKSATGQVKVTIDLLTDTWSVAVAMHYFIFGCHPYFFLNVMGPKEIRDYLDKFQWPAVDWLYPSFNKNNRKFYQGFQKSFNAVDPSIKRAFEVTFREGVTKRHQRASYTQWVQLLKPRVKPIPFAAANLKPLPSIPPTQALGAQIQGTIGAVAPAQQATPQIVQYPPISPGISINWKMAIGAACLALLLLIVSTTKKSTEPTGSKVPDGRLEGGKLATPGPQASATPSNIQKLEPPDPAQQIASAAIYTAGQTFRDCAGCPEMVAIPAGSFEMGSNDGERDERPVHRVGVPAFALAKTEVTQSQWQAVMGSNPDRFKPCGDACPMEKVSWQDAQDYVQRLSAKTGEPYRLPSEAEWEYACRAGSRQTYCGSDNLNSVAWYGKIRNVSSGGNYPYAVGQKQANAFGLYDMSGNIWEWVEDCYHTSYVGAPSDGSAWISECSGNRRVMRGGSWLNGPGSARPAYRIVTPPADRVDAKGFRPARMLPTVSTQQQQSEQESALPDRLEAENQGLTNSSKQSSVPTPTPTPLPADSPTVRCILPTGADTRISRTECRDRSGIIFDGE